MAESFISDIRAVFPQGDQHDFLKSVLSKMSISGMAHVCACSERSVRDWRREKFSMPYAALTNICTAIDEPIPSGITLRSHREHLRTVATLGGVSTFRKYGNIGGDAQYRHVQWMRWWNTEGRHSCRIMQAKPFRQPVFSTELAEFVGIVLGDGGISDYQLTITLYRDEEAYGSFVVDLLQKLFDVPVEIRVREQDSTITYTISRSALVRFCISGLGLHKGSKVQQQVDIPAWISKDKTYVTACIRGLFDTDGSFFSHSYVAKGKRYSYTKAAFSNRSLPLLRSVHTLLNQMGITARYSNSQVWLDSAVAMERYRALIGSNNQKHLKKCAR